MSRLQPVHEPVSPSLWWLEAMAAEPSAKSAEPLAGIHTADICIVGGGYTGLWTALRIKELDPTVDVVLIEARLCGSGASGRNGGMVNAWWSKLPTLRKVCGTDEALFLARAASDAIGEIGRVCAENGIDAHFRQRGWIHAATTPLHLGKWNEAVEACEGLGLDVYQRLDPEQVRLRAGSPVYAGGVLEKDSATVQPALLARGLRRVAIQRGVRIFENSPVTEIVRGQFPIARTARGVVAAKKLVLATNAWTASLPDVRRDVIVVSSDMVATAPVPNRIAEIGWTGGESVSDARLMVHYHHVTHDGRVAIGRGSGALAYMGRVTPTFDGSTGKAVVVERGLRKIYPSLSDVPITHRWGGPIDRSRSGTLVFGHLDDSPNILYGIGYSGTGVAPSVVGGKILASTALELDDAWSRTRLNQGPLLRYPPDPIRFFGGLGVRAVLTRKEEGEEDGIAPSPLATKISALAYPTLPRNVRSRT